MNYQGFLTDLTGSPVADGSYRITFSLYVDEAGGAALWTEIHPTVAVNKGLFTVVLGRGNPANPLTVAFDREYYLGVTIGTDPELSPRVRLTSSAYSMRSRTAETIIDGAVTTAKIADDAVTGSKIANGAIGTPQLVDGAVVATKIASNVISADHIAPPIVSSISGVTNDGGDINLVAGANVTITPDDAANTITIAAAPSGGGLTLPYSKSIANSATAFDIENTGAGSTAEFKVTNTSSTNPAVTIKTNSTNSNSDALAVEAAGGNAVQAINNSPNMAAIGGTNTGDGMVASLFKLAASSGDILRVHATGGTGKVINATYGGTAQAVYVNTISSSSGDGLEVDNDGTGMAAYFHTDNTTSGKFALTSENKSTASGGGAIRAEAVAGYAVDSYNNSASLASGRFVNANTGDGAISLYARSYGKEGTIVLKNYNAASDALILEGYSGVSNSRFKMQNNGDLWSYGQTSSTASVQRGNLGSSATPEPGGYYRDNAIYAWANIYSTGVINGAFGCTVSKTATGTYSITYKRALAGGDYAPMAIAYENSAPQFAVISGASATGCTVKIWRYNTSTNTFALVDSQFFFQLCGRP